MNSISIIGCGWLGFDLGRFLIEKGFQVKGSTTSIEKLQKLEKARIQPFYFKAGKSLKGEQLSEFFTTDILIINIPPQRQGPDVEHLHFTEVKNIIDEAVEAKIEKLIYCSSTGVYPDCNDEVTELTPASPITASAKALVRIENYLLSKENIKSTILRFSGLVGGGRNPGRFLAGKTELPNGDAPINLVHREDCIRVIYEVIRQNAWGEIFNVCADKHPKRKEFYPRQALQLGLEPPTFLKEKITSFKIVSNQKLKERLEYKFIYPDPNDF